MNEGIADLEGIRRLAEERGYVLVERHRLKPFIYQYQMPYDLPVGEYANFIRHLDGAAARAIGMAMLEDGAIDRRKLEPDQYIFTDRYRYIVTAIMPLKRPQIDAEPTTRDPGVPQSSSLDDEGSSS